MVNHISWNEAIISFRKYETTSSKKGIVGVTAPTRTNDFGIHRDGWAYSKVGVSMGGAPNHHLNRIFHCKPSINKATLTILRKKHEM